MAVRVLFTDHTSSFSGAEVAMMRLIRALPADVEPAVACPPTGRLAEALGEQGITQFPIAGTDVSFRLHPTTTASGLATLARSAIALRSITRRWRADVVHANGVRAGLLAIAAKYLGGPPVVVQVHDHLPQTKLGRAVREVIARGADETIAVSDWTARVFNQGLRRAVARTVYISFDQNRFRAEAYDRSAVRRGLSIADDAPLLGEVAQITPWKGQIVAIEAMPGIRAAHPEAQLLLVGHIAFSGSGVRYDNAAYLDLLKRRTRELGLEACVHFLGQRSDVPAIMTALDVLLLPSWDEPFGTVALEALAVGTIPVVGSSGGVTEYVEDGVCGQVVAPTDTARWVEAVTELLSSEELRRAMSERGRVVAARFTDEAYAAGCTAAYEAALRKPRPSRHARGVA